MNNTIAALLVTLPCRCNLVIESRYELGPKIITNLREDHTFDLFLDAKNSGLRRAIGTSDTALESIFCLLSRKSKMFFSDHILVSKSTHYYRSAFIP